MLLDSAISTGETKASALANVMGGKEWFVKEGVRLRRHAASSIADCNANEFTRLGARAVLCLGRVNLLPRSAESQSAASRHGVARIEDEGNDGLLHRPRIGLNRGNLRSDNGPNMDLFADQAADYGAEFAEESVDIH